MMMAASHKEGVREEKKEPPIVTDEGSKQLSNAEKGEHSRRAFCILLVLNIILSTVAVLCGAGAFVYTYLQINSLQKQVNDSVHSCAQLNEDGTQASWQHLQQNVSMLYDRIHELDSVYTKISAIEFNVSQLNANSTNVQLINLAFALSELQHDLDSTTRDFLTTKSALEVNISQLKARANSIDMQLQNLTATLDEAHDGLQQTISLLRAELFSRVSTIESQLDTYANGTDEQLRDLNSALSEMRYNLTSTRQELLASKSAIDVLNAHANGTDMQLRNITATLGELHGDIDDNQHQLNHLSLMHDEHEQKIHQITLNMLRFHENVSLSQEIQVQEVSALQFNVSSLNSQISAIKHDIIQHDNLTQRFYNEQSRIDARVMEIEAKVNSAFTPLSTASPHIVLLSITFVLYVQV